jgi:competence protein ComGC
LDILVEIIFDILRDEIMKINIKKLNDERGISGLMFIIVVLAILVLCIVIVPKVFTKGDSKLSELDNEQIEFAERQANIEFQQNHKAFEGVFDTENKRFVDQKKARSTVTPYGTSKEHQGMYIIITVDENGNISSRWISP